MAFGDETLTEVTMSIVYNYTLKHDRNGRIVEKVETVNGKAMKWTYSYDGDGRLFEAHLDGRLICQCYYDKQGRRQQDYFPRRHGRDIRNYSYRMDNRLQQAGNNGYTHDKNGFRSIWNHEGKYTTYQYAPDYCLLRAEQEDAGIVFEFSHDKNGQREVKYRNGEMVEAYKWLDFIRLAGFHDGESGYRFRYDDDERTPYAMQREDGAVAYLYHDQVGSLRVVADQSGSMIKEVLYDPFGGIIEDTNPGLRVPLGFAGGLHDRDLGFVRFGLRDYDTYTSRWTAPDPIGDKGGDPDWYGYCLDDPVNGVDPLGLFRFGKRGLGGLPLLGILSDNPIDDAFNTEIAHEHGFYEDGTGKNVGLFKEGVRQDTENIRDYELEEKRYGDKRMHRVVDSLEEQKYNLLGIGGKKNNCQDYADKMRDRYWLLNRGDRQR
jgi:RHS repeat-associated protein